MSFHFLETRNFPFLSASAPANFLFQMINYFSSLFLTISSPFLCYFLQYPFSLLRVFPYSYPFPPSFLTVSSLLFFYFLPHSLLFPPLFIPHSFLAVSSLVPYCFLLRPLLFYPLFLTDFLTYTVIPYYFPLHSLRILLFSLPISSLIPYCCTHHSVLIPPSFLNVFSLTH